VTKKESQSERRRGRCTERKIVRERVKRKSYRQTISQKDKEREREWGGGYTDIKKESQTKRGR
jgi:hypothetical protein